MEKKKTNNFSYRESYLAKNSTAWSIRPENATRPSAINIIRSKELNMSELGWCMVHNTVRPFAANDFNWEITQFAEWESCPVVGSSKNNIFGSVNNWEKSVIKKNIIKNGYIYIDNKKKDLPYRKKENKKKISNKLERNCYTFKRKKKIKYCKKEYI